MSVKVEKDDWVSVLMDQTKDSIVINIILSSIRKTTHKVFETIRCEGFLLPTYKYPLSCRRRKALSQPNFSFRELAFKFFPLKSGNADCPLF